jgi:hypothetical protein
MDSTEVGKEWASENFFDIEVACGRRAFLRECERGDAECGGVGQQLGRQARIESGNYRGEESWR